MTTDTIECRNCDGTGEVGREGHLDLDDQAAVIAEVQYVAAHLNDPADTRGDRLQNFARLGFLAARASWLETTSVLREGAGGEVPVDYWSDGMTTLIAQAREFGHDGHCDLDAGCSALATQMLAEATNPDLLDGDAALAFYCDQHAHLVPVAELAAVQRAANLYAGTLWQRVLKDYPNPVRIAAPERLRHHEYGTEPFTAAELDSIEKYEELIAGTPDTLDAVAVDADNWPPEFTRDDVLAAYKSLFPLLSEWYEHLDSLKADLQNPHEGPAHSTAAYRYLQQECINWYQALHTLRREACRYAYGYAGPRPEVASGYVTFGDIPGIQLDGTIAAESR